MMQTFPAVRFSPPLDEHPKSFSRVGVKQLIGPRVPFKLTRFVAAPTEPIAHPQLAESRDFHVILDVHWLHSLAM